MRNKNWFFIYLILIIPFVRISGQVIQTVVQTGHYAAVTAACYSADGLLIATGSSDKI
jgi:hypothetical protein